MPDVSLERANKLTRGQRALACEQAPGKRRGTLGRHDVWRWWWEGRCGVVSVRRTRFSGSGQSASASGSVCVGGGGDEVGYEGWVMMNE